MPKASRLLCYVEQAYSLGILRPLQAEARRQGRVVKWFVANPKLQLPFAADEEILSLSEAIAFNPEAVFVPGDRVPSFIPGLKVQVFHGLNEDKRGNQYPERGLFDLYCTEGPDRTAMIKPYENKGYLKVVETGWIKLDALFNHQSKLPPATRPTILFASTFTPRLSCAESLYDEIKRLSQLDKWHWVVTLHPKMDPATVEKYQALVNSNLSFYNTEHVIDLQHHAHIMVSDNSSVLQEFLLLKKPVVTFKHRVPGNHVIDITDPKQLEQAINAAFLPDPIRDEAIAAYGPSITPILDGQSSGRVLTAVDQRLENWVDKKPLNLWRNFQMRRKLNHYKW